MHRDVNNSVGSVIKPLDPLVRIIEQSSLQDWALFVVYGPRLLQQQQEKMSPKVASWWMLLLIDLAALGLPTLVVISIVARAIDKCVQDRCYEAGYAACVLTLFLGLGVAYYSVSRWSCESCKLKPKCYGHREHK